MLSIQVATLDNVDAICMLDQIAQQEITHEEFVSRAVVSGSCYIAVDEQIKGYAVLEYSFFETGFISMVYVRPDVRQQGIGTSLLSHLEKICKTDKLFTSTNLSNQPMQSILARLGFRLSGIVHDLDEGDPELIYVKFLHH